jgi:hypothetical protein
MHDSTVAVSRRHADDGNRERRVATDAPVPPAGGAIALR